MEDVWRWTASQTARHVALGDVSAREVAEACLARIAEVEPRLNALSEVTQDIALAAADAVDAARLAGAALGPLAGVPITTKNNVDQAGTLNTGGVALARDNRAADDSPLVASLKSAGAVVVGRSNVPAFSLRWFTDTEFHGRTYNPHGRHLSPGGSSGGAGVAVASGLCALAHGNDIGGSIRQPALMNGIVGLRPTVGRVASFNPSGDGMRAMTSQFITADGPLARSVGDMALGLNAMAGRDARDPQQVPMPPVGAGALPARVGLVRGPGLGGVAPQVNTGLERAAKVLGDAGCAVQEVTLPRFAEAYRIWTRLVFHAVNHHYMPFIRASGDSALLHKVETAIQIVGVPDAGEVLDMWAQRLQIMRAWSEMFARLPVVIMPLSCRHGLRVGADQGDAASLEQLFQDQSPLLATALLGHPALAVPVGLAEDGVPLGVQLVGAWWNEATLLAAGQVIEDAVAPLTPVDPI